VLVSCSPESNTQNKQEDASSETEQITPATEEEASAPEQEVAPPVFTIIDKCEFDLSQLSYEGELRTQKCWLDAKGENIVLFSGQEDLAKGEATVYAYHYLLNDGQATLLKDLNATVDDCADADLFLDFNEQAFAITDLDEDNIGEITFAYRTACVTDVSPHDLVLHLFENGQDYSLVGNTNVRVGAEERMGGDVSETYFDSAPASFLTHANEVWEKIKQY
ncbi:MAG: hypothetical protein AAFR36_20925, partial [Bacteroidota bacterium]